ncbi:hypothetical protein GCM10027187_41010 [Streptosporangium sandarakinum]|uniref:Uncharacterized protein n=1 Tax=Streptosporangium sandarakinum TaxID=1260955 RepID=A0A852VAL3_9ACTN|nr:hypothetical protein [Streptosporangium sandarakinum]NYF44568.1 hypothetical protein [Streptosporangium sandarakinum]
MDVLDEIVGDDMRLPLLLIAALHDEAERLIQDGPGSGEEGRR